MRKSRGGVVAIVFLLSATSAMAAADSSSVAVIPFEQTGGGAELYWIGEGLAISISDQLALPGITVVSREALAASYEKLGLPLRYRNLSRATLLKLAGELKLNYLVLGEYRAAEGRLAVECSIIDVSKPRLLARLAESAPLVELAQLENNLSWRILDALGLNRIFSRREFTGRTRKMPREAFSNFVKGLLATDPKIGIRFLQRAVKEYPAEPKLYFYLGKAYHQLGEKEKALDWLSKLRSGDVYYEKAQFILGSINFSMGRLNQALMNFFAVFAETGVPEALNNAAVAYCARRDYQIALSCWQYAERALSKKNDLLLNMALGRLLAGETGSAVRILNDLVKLNPSNGAAYFLLAAVHRRDGREDEANKALELAMRFSGEGGADGSPAFEDEQRLVKHLRLMQPEFLEPRERIRQPERPLPDDLKSAEVSFANGEHDKVLSAVTDTIALDPTHARAHFLLGRLFLSQERKTEAIAEFKIALLFEPLVEARLALAGLYLEQKDFQLAQLEVESALRLDPANEAALLLKEELRQKLDDRR